MIELSNLQECPSCYNFDRSDKPMIEVIKIHKNSEDKLQMHHNEVVCVVEGKIRTSFKEIPRCDVQRGQIVFIPAGGLCTLTAIKPSLVVVMRLNGNTKLCENYALEHLYNLKGHNLVQGNLPPVKEAGVLNTHAHVSFFIKGLINILEDGVKCKSFFELKINEFFFLLHICYTQKELHDFFSQILSKDTAFSEYVRKNNSKYHTVKELADSMRISSKQFSRRFKVVFGQTAYAWMKEEKAYSIRQEIRGSDKPFKLIAVEYGFGSISSFAKFCKKEFGETPLKLRKSETGNIFSIGNNCQIKGRNG